MLPAAKGVEGGMGEGEQRILIKGGRVYRHDGGNNGFVSSLEYYPDQGMTVILLSNLGFTPVEAMRDELARVALAATPSIMPGQDP